MTRLLAVAMGTSSLLNQIFVDRLLTIVGDESDEMDLTTVLVEDQGVTALRWDRINHVGLWPSTYSYSWECWFSDGVVSALTTNASFRARGSCFTTYSRASAFPQ